MAEYGGGFAGDRAGLMNLQQTLAGVTQNQMQGRQMDMMRQNMMFQQGMAQKEFQNTQAQQAYQRKMMPWQIAAQMGGWQMDEPQRLQFYPEMYQRIMGGKGSVSPGGGVGPGMGLPPSGPPQGANPPIGNDITDIRGGDPQVIGDLAGTALGGMMGAPFGKAGMVGGAALGSTATNYLMNKAYDFGHPEDVEYRRALANPSDYSPFPTNTPVFPTPMSGAMGQAINSTSAKNVNKRNNRAVKAPNMDSVGLPSQPTAVSLPGPQ